MTIPIERRTAIKAAWDFMFDLMNPSKTPRVPLKIRKRARSVLKHYPSEWDMERAEKDFEDVFGKKEQK
jgi:hypothetical protein